MGGGGGVDIPIVFITFIKALYLCGSVFGFNWVFVSARFQNVDAGADYRSNSISTSIPTDLRVNDWFYCTTPTSDCAGYGDMTAKLN